MNEFMEDLKEIFGMGATLVVGDVDEDTGEVIIEVIHQE